MGSAIFNHWLVYCTAPPRNLLFLPFEAFFASSFENRGLRYTDLIFPKPNLKAKNVRRLSRKYKTMRERERETPSWWQILVSSFNGWQSLVSTLVGPCLLCFCSTAVCKAVEKSRWWWSGGEVPYAYFYRAMGCAIFYHWLCAPPRNLLFFAIWSLFASSLEK